ICISELSHLEFSAFLSTDGAATIAIAKNGTNFTGLMQLNNDYSLLFYHDGKINMEGLIKQMELKGYMYQGAMGNDDVVA
ncbi:hypothetical protein OFC21_34080, partial [Escherichia coli]|nr:hypothetical protein [Escherichia coli]